MKILNRTSLLFLLPIICNTFLLGQEMEGPPKPSEQQLEREIQETGERLKQDILRASQEIQNQQAPTTTQGQSLLVILTPYQRTVLSNQISTPILSSQVSSIVEKIYKRMGEYFKKGELLLKIDDTIFQANYKKSEAAVNRAEVLLYTRQQLYKDKIISYIDLKDAEASAASAEAEFVLASTQLDGAYVLAPYDGRVISLSIEENELPQPGQALMEIEETDRLLAKILYPSIYYNTLTIGAKIKLHINETNTDVDARIIRIGGAIDPSSATIAVDAEIDNSEGKLMSGMTGSTSTADLKNKEQE